MQIGVLVGPLIGGLLVAYVGIGWCFLVDIVGLFVRLDALRRDAALPPRGRRPRRPAWPASARGCGTPFGRRDLLGTYLVDITAMLLAMPVVLFPALAEKVFGNPQLLGFLYSAETVGALLATALCGWTSRVHHHGRAIVIAALGVRRVRRAGRPDAQHLAGALLLRARRRRRHDLGGLPGHDLEPDHPRGHARPAGRHRDAVATPSARWPARSAPASSPTVWSVRGADRQRRRLACVAGVAITAAWLHDFWSYDERTDEHALAERRARYSAGEPAGPGAT